MGSGSIVDEIQYSYDDWGNVIKFAMDRNSAITSGQLTGSNGYYDFEQAYTKSTSTSGRKTVRLTSMTWPSGDTADYSYLIGDYP